MNRRLLALLSVPLWLGGCALAASKALPVRPSSTEVPPPIRFESVAARAGIDFKLGHGGRSPLTILETAGGGCAFTDLDGDDWPDILLVGPHNVALYRNERNGSFRNVTAGSGLKTDRYWMGCTSGDYDADGLPDLFLTGYRCHALYRNLGGGRFADVTASSGIPDLPWSLSAAFGDVDGDQDLDLYISQYLHFDKGTDQVCQLGTIRSACGPEVYEAISGRLYLNDGSRFRPVSGWKDTGKTWGVLISRMTGRKRPDIYLANDMAPGDHWVSDGSRYTNQGAAFGTAYDADGRLQGGMGVDSADYNNDGRLDLLVTTFFAQPNSLYRNDGDGLFTVTSGRTGLGAASMRFVGFGTAFADFDNDGWQDLILANGHVRDNVDGFDKAQSYAQPVQVFLNDQGSFQEVTSQALPPGLSLVGRGLSIADYNRDGRRDVLIVDLEGSAVLLRNETEAAGRWVQIELRDTNKNRYGLNALVEVQAGSARQVREIKTSGSVMSALEPVAHFGLGDHTGPVEVKVTWPDGKVQTERLEKTDTRTRITRAGK